MKKAGFFARYLVAIALLGCVVSTTLGQTSTESTSAKTPNVSHFYHLVFVVKELEAGRIINSRSYAMSIAKVENSISTPFNSNASTRSIRTGTRIPVEYETGKVSYVDVGVNIDCKNVVDFGSSLGMDVSADISSIQNDSAIDHSRTQTPITNNNPMIQQNKWNSQVSVVLGKPTVLFSSDEVTSKRTLELELTATEIK
jgi:hypothetical protein